MVISTYYLARLLRRMLPSPSEEKESIIVNDIPMSWKEDLAWMATLNPREVEGKVPSRTREFSLLGESGARVYVSSNIDSSYPISTLYVGANITVVDPLFGEKKLFLEAIKPVAGNLWEFVLEQVHNKWIHSCGIESICICQNVRELFMIFSDGRIVCMDINVHSENFGNCLFVNAELRWSSVCKTETEIPVKMDEVLNPNFTWQIWEARRQKKCTDEKMQAFLMVLHPCAGRHSFARMLNGDGAVECIIWDMVRQEDTASWHLGGKDQVLELRNGFQ
jgi:hypothetical protein